MFSGAPVKDWWTQRIFAFLSIPLFLCALLSFVPSFILHGNVFLSKILQSHPLQIFLLVCLIVCFLFHALCGMKVIIRDYIKSYKIRFVLFLFLDCFSCVTFLVFLLAVFFNSQLFA